MSFLPINEENKEAPVGQTTNAPSAPPPPQTSGSAGAAPDAPKGASAGSPTQFGSSASKLADYLSANAPQITQQADTLTGKLNQQYGDVSQGITNAANQFGQTVQGGYTAPNQDVIGQAMQNPTDFAASPENIEAFRRQYNNAYTGPLNFEGTSPYSQIQSQVGQAVQQGNLLGSESGLQSYLQGQGTNPNRASATLDTLLLQGNPEAQAKIRGAASQLGTLDDQFQTATAGANQSVLDAQKAAADASAYARGQFDPYVSDFNKSIQDQAAAAEAQRQAFNQSLAGNQLKANLGREDLLAAKQTGLDPLEAHWAKSLYNAAPQTRTAMETVRGYFNPDLSKYDSWLGTKMDNSLATPTNTASADQYQRAQSLSQLLGQGYESPLDPTNIAYAGTYKTPNTPMSVEEANANAGIQKQRINDLMLMYTGPFGDSNMTGGGGPKALPYNEVASRIIQQYKNQPELNQWAPQSPEMAAALQRLAANSYGI